jgi:hypothetical protein
LNDEQQMFFLLGHFKNEFEKISTVSPMIDFDELETALFLKDFVDSIVDKVFDRSGLGTPARHRGIRLG